MANIGFISLGCAKNQVDCERMMYRVQEAGHTVKGDIVGSDVVVINTCGFIDSAKSEAIDFILQTAALKAEGLVGKILVTGCLSQRYQTMILEEMPEVDGILGTGSYTEIVPAIEALLNDEQVVDFGSIDAPEQETGRIMTTPEHYAFIKIAEGCDNRCSYCIIPYLRGKFRSRQMDDVLYEARLLAASGVKELIVVAQDTSRYGTDLPGHKRLLPELIHRLCAIEDFRWLLIKAPARGVHFLVVLSQFSEYKELKWPEKMFRHLVYQWLAKEELADIIGFGRSARIPGGAVRYVSKKDAFSLRPYLWPGLIINGWTMDENGDAVEASDEDDEFI